jgi:hypothetical protein
MHTLLMVDVLPQNLFPFIARKVFPAGAGTVRTLERYLIARELIAPGQTTTPSQTRVLSEQYVNHLREVRGFSISTASSHRRPAEGFLQQLKETCTALGHLRALTSSRTSPRPGKRLSRGTLQQDIAALS